jgi:acetoin utilization deacetylase AcuC-like enzyme
MPLHVFSDDAMLLHEPGPGHPERPGRLVAARRGMDGLDVAWHRPTPAPREALEAVHDPDYVAQLLALDGRTALLDPDTVTSDGSIRAALLAAGAAIGAVDTALSGQPAFALVRPPGHHAERGAAMGFCLLDNIAIAAEHARKTVERVLIVDWDVHAGNGTAHLFERRRDVLVFDTHQSPFYPGTGHAHEVGAEDGLGFTVNVPLPAGMDDGDYAHAFAALLDPIAEQFRPELVLVSAGYDAHTDDPLGEMDVTDEGFAVLAGHARRIADRYASGRLACVLEGGYDLDALAASVRATSQVLLGAAPPAVRGPSREGIAAVRRVIEAQKPYWRF